MLASQSRALWTRI